MIWKIEIEKKAVKELSKLNSTIRNLIKSHLKEKISASVNPRVFGKSLRGKLLGYWCYRVEDYRIICVIEDETETVKVLKVAHRRNVYD